MANSPLPNSPLPTWDLSDLYAGPEDPQLAADLETLRHKAKTFADMYEEKVAGLSSPEFGAAIERYEDVSEIAGKISSFAYLYFASQVTEEARGRFRQSMDEQLTSALQPTLFFTLEMQALSIADLDAKLSDPLAAKYAPWIDTSVRPFATYRLSKDLETYIAEDSATTRAGFVRLFDETMAGLSVEVRGETLSQEQALTNMQSPDRALREESAKAMTAALKDRTQTLTLITNTLAKAKEMRIAPGAIPAPWPP